MHPSTAEINAEQLLLAAGIILGLGSVLGFVARKAKVPDIVLYLLAGILLGKPFADLVGLHHVMLNLPATSTASWLILLFGSSYILFDGGAMLRFKVLKEIWISLGLIVTVGVLLTAAVVGLIAYGVLNMAVAIPLTGAMLLGSAVAATDPAALVVVFKKLNIKKRVAQFVVSESAFNDPVGTVITFVFLAIVMASAHLHGGTHAEAPPTLAQDFIDFARDLGFGVLVGVGLGYFASQMVAHEKVGVLQEYLPVVTVIVVIASFITAQVGLNASGFMATFIAGLVVGNMEVFGIKVPEKEHARLEDFVETTSMMARMFIFFLLGSQVQLTLVAQYWWEGLLIVGALMFIARPLAVFACALPDRRAKWSFKEMLFLSWTRETGVIPGTLASILVATGAPNANVIAAIIFIVIVVTICLQATTAKWAAGKLGLLEDPTDESGAESPRDATNQVHAAVDGIESALADMRSTVDSIDAPRRDQPRTHHPNPSAAG